jgi:ferredoxin
MALAKRYAIKEIRGVCGGNLSCASCHLLIKTPACLTNRSEEEEDMLYTLAEPYPLKNSRLSCQVTLTKELNGLEIIIVNN